MDQSVGRRGELLAAEYLVASGYTILHTNYRTKVGEIDIIAQKNEVIYFVEVKTRRGDKHGKPYEAVTYVKQKHMLRSAQWYVLQNKKQKSKLRLAVVSVEINGDKETIQLFKLEE